MLLRKVDLKKIAFSYVIMMHHIKHLHEHYPTNNLGSSHFGFWNAFFWGGEGRQFMLKLPQPRICYYCPLYTTADSLRQSVTNWKLYSMLIHVQILRWLRSMLVSKHLT